MAPSPPKILQLFGTVILVLGLIGAAAIYATAGDDPDNAIGYEVVNLPVGTLLGRRSNVGR